MKKNTLIYKCSIVCIIFFLSTAVMPALSTNIATTLSNDSVETIEFIQHFSSPEIIDNDLFAEVSIQQASSVLTDEGKPMLPVYVKTFEFGFGTNIKDVDITIGNVHTIQLEKQISAVPFKKQMSSLATDMKISSHTASYESLELEIYPYEWYSYHTGVGITKENERTLFFILHFYPTRYNIKENSLQYTTEVEISITYENNNTAIGFGEGLDLVVIAPDQYADSLYPLINHKNDFGLSTDMFFVEDIYDQFSGRDNAEKIKYFIKYAIEQWDIRYVLLVGDITKIPIRHTYASPWQRDILSDLYYADVFNNEYQFSCWDANENNKFGEVDEEGNDIDGVDLFADVHVGRIACVDSNEVDVVVNKIIAYEKTTYGSDWFHKIILAGGDTFPPFYSHADFDVFEGEITNYYVSQALPEFESIFLWASERNLNAITFNRAINKGAGFLSYAGHGFEHGWGTYRPNAMADRLILYYMPFVRLLKNQEKLPIVFFDACLTAKLDFNISDLQNYYPVWIDLIVRLTKVDYDILDFYPSYAWSMVAKKGGGAIATVGATRLAYTWVNEHGVFAGAGYLDISFFEAFEEGVTVGEMLTHAQLSYISDVGFDYFTIEEYILLGDPSLRVGGYPI